LTKKGTIQTHSTVTDLAKFLGLSMSVPLNKALINSNRHLFILEYNEIPVGTIREDRVDKDEFELSYVISPKYRGKKIGQIMISLYLIGRKGSFLCEVKEENFSSIKMIENLDFKLFKTENRVNFYKLNHS